MTDMRFDDRVAIVTGAGGNPGLGRAHAMLLASRGAKVVVNDLGAGKPLRGSSTNARAEVVVKEILDAGGEAVADAHSVFGEENAAAVVKTALDAFGRIDILVNNAGVAWIADLDEMSSADIELTINTHVLGTIYMARAVWPHMREQGYGRVVNTTSGAGYHGLPRASVYAAAKGAIFGFTRTLAIDGAPLGIVCNSIAPGAFSGMWPAAWGKDHEIVKAMEHNPAMRAELVSPTVAFLAHESCPVTGQCLSAMGGRTTQVLVSETAGITEAEPSPESLQANWPTVADSTDAILLTTDGLLQMMDPSAARAVVYKA
jgi:NAD(P)-dependent dehydrogenase (short-subunit alcohol dehydrogenase family)